MKVKMRKVNPIPSDDEGITMDNQIEFIPDGDGEDSQKPEEETNKWKACFSQNSASLKKLLFFIIFIVVLGISLSLAVTYGKRHVQSQIIIIDVKFRY
jgi:hypothetical protein